jgi:hypothetical protein
MKTKSLVIGSLILLSSIFFASCEDLWDNCIEGNGKKMVENRILNEFNSIEINGDFEVRIDTGNTQSAEIITDANLMEEIETRVSNNKLVIETREDICLNPSHTIEITLTTHMLKQVVLNGSGYTYCYGLETNQLLLNIAGSGRIKFDNLITNDLNIDVEGSGATWCDVVSGDVTTNLSGSGEIIMYGACTNVNHQVIGSGRIKADEMTSDVCTVNISGSGTVYTQASDALKVTISGSGIVYYKGNPNIDSNISGSGKVIKR